MTKKKPFTVVPRMYTEGGTKAAKGSPQVQRGWNLKWSDGTTGIPSADIVGYIATARDWENKDVVRALGTIAAHKGFKGFR